MAREIRPWWDRLRHLPGLYRLGIAEGYGVRLALEVCWSVLVDPVGTMHMFREGQRISQSKD